MLFLLPFVMSLRPTYDCVSPCIASPENLEKQEFVFKTMSGQSRTMTLKPKIDTNFRIFFSRKYIESEVDIYIKNKLVKPFYKQVELNPLLQVVKYNIYEHSLKKDEVLEVLISSKSRIIRWSLEIGTTDQIDALQLLHIPIDMIHMHGTYWSDRLHDWIFFVLSYIVAVLFISTKFGYQLIIPSLAIYAIAGFTGALGSKLYHLSVASFRIDDADTLAFSILVIAICFEVIPALYAYAHIRFYVQRPYLIGSMTFFVAAGISFGGSGYYIGAAFLGLAAIFTISKKIAIGCMNA